MTDIGCLPRTFIIKFASLYNTMLVMWLSIVHRLLTPHLPNPTACAKRRRQLAQGRLPQAPPRGAHCSLTASARRSSRPGQAQAPSTIVLGSSTRRCAMHRATDAEIPQTYGALHRLLPPGARTAQRHARKEPATAACQPKRWGNRRVRQATTVGCAVPALRRVHENGRAPGGGAR